MDARLLPYATQNAPRYTSYPTAPHFNDSVNGETFARWLGELDEDAALSLYLHVPYCREICWYCGCNTYAAQRDEPLAEYADTLIRELDMTARATPARRVQSLHWGGGTPNILSAERFETIFKRLDYWFDLYDIEEHAIELDPRTLTAAQAETYGRLGVTRASLGVQDLTPRVQEAIGRVQPLAVVKRAVDALRRSGVRELSFDLMYGLPHQTPEDSRRTAEACARLAPNRISVFGYAHVPWFKTRQKLIDEAALPDTAARMEAAEAVRAALEQEGYVAIGFDHYARPDDPLAKAAQSGALKRNFQGYVHDDADALIGLGASAISTLPQGYAQNASEVGAWARAIKAGQFATARGRALTDADRTRRALIERILCDFAVDLDTFGGASAYADELSALSPLAADGLVRISGAQLTVPDDARPLARLVAQAFDAYQAQGGAKHSKAV